MSLDANTPSSSRFVVNSSNHSGKARNRFLRAGTMMSLFLMVFLVPVGSRSWFPNTGMLVLSRRGVAGLDEESSDVSCGNDVGDALALELEEPVDNPGTTISCVVLSVALDVSAFLELDVVSDHWPTQMNIRDLRRVLPSGRTAGVSSRICTVTSN